MKTLILTLLIFSAFSTISNAQTSKCTQCVSNLNVFTGSAKDLTSKLTRDLRLDNSQVARVFVLNLKFDTKYESIQQGVKSTDDEYQIAMTQLGNDRDMMMENILDRKQFLLYRENR